MLDKFLTDTDNSAVTPVEPSTANILGLVPTYVPVHKCPPQTLRPVCAFASPATTDKNRIRCVTPS
jgi:hypothetical protein